MENSSDKIEINIPKEIKAYKEELILGLDLRACVCFSIGILFCGLEWFIFSHTLHVKGWIMSFLYVVTAGPFGFLGIFNYNGRNAFQMLAIWIKYYFLQDHHLMYRPDDLVSMAEQASKRPKRNKKNKKRGNR